MRCKIFCLVILTLVVWILSMPPVFGESGEQRHRSISIKEIFFTQPLPAEDLDSPAVWSGPDKERWLIVTAKKGHRIHIYDADNGHFLRTFGAPGDSAGNFQRPNGIWVASNTLYIVERDNHRIQLLSLPDLNTLGFIGENRLIKPYGIYVREMAGTRHHVYVTDNYDIVDPAKTDESIGYGKRVCFFQVELGDKILETGKHAEIPAYIGDDHGKGVLETVESIYGDPVYDRLLIADEADGAHHIKVYTLNGKFTGQILGDGIFRHEPEGIALYTYGRKAGYWICTDQDPDRSVYHVFDRQDLSYLGCFQGAYTRNTDGIWISPVLTAQFPAGSFYALDDDQRIAAFSMKEILDAMELKSTTLLQKIFDKPQ